MLVGLAATIGLARPSPHRITHRVSLFVWWVVDHCALGAVEVEGRVCSVHYLYLYDLYVIYSLWLSTYGRVGCLGALRGRGEVTTEHNIYNIYARENIPPTVHIVPQVPYMYIEWKL